MATSGNTGASPTRWMHQLGQQSFSRSSHVTHLRIRDTRTTQNLITPDRPGVGPEEGTGRHLPRAGDGTSWTGCQSSCRS